MQATQSQSEFLCAYDCDIERYDRVLLKSFTMCSIGIQAALGFKQEQY